MRITGLYIMDEELKQSSLVLKTQFSNSQMFKNSAISAGSTSLLISKLESSEFSPSWTLSVLMCTVWGKVPWVAPLASGNSSSSCLIVLFKCLCKNRISSTVSLSYDARRFKTAKSATEKTRSLGTDVAGIERYLRANSASLGYLVSDRCHYFRGSAILTVS